MDADETVDALPVLHDATGVAAAGSSPGSGLGERLGAGAMLPAVQAAAVAAGGFVAGAAVVGLVHRRGRRSAALAGGRKAGRAVSRRGGPRTSPAGQLVQIVGSRSLLLDVHLLGGPSGDAR